MMAPKIGTVPGGMRKLPPIWRSMVVAWLTKKVWSCWKERGRAMVATHMGKTLMNDLSSSTCVNVHSLQRFLAFAPSGSTITAALSKNLHVANLIDKWVQTKYFQNE